MKLKCLFGHRVGPQRHHEHNGQFYLEATCVECQRVIASTRPIATKAQRDRLDREARRQIAELGPKALAYPANIAAAVDALEVRERASADAARSRRDIAEAARRRADAAREGARR